MNVLSLFDGISCGRIALERAGIPVTKYYASEIDKHAIKVTMHNYPDTIHLGSVTEIYGHLMPEIDLLIGGSPCQGFSINGKQLNFNDERSKLLFEFKRLKDELNPKHWMLENVATMNTDIKIAIDELMGVKGQYMNSNILSAQNRKRLYWTNIQFSKIEKPCKLNIENILDKTINQKRYWKQSKIDEQVFNSTVTDGVITLNPKMKNNKQTYQQDRIYDCKGKFVALTATLGDRFNIKDNNGYIRKLTIREQARLQNIPDNYDFDCVGSLAASSAIGNGWTVDVIAHIFKNLPKC